jgi:hypothetical protein
MCFLASVKEKEVVLNRFQGKSFGLILSFGSVVFHLKNVQIVYQVNYINQQFAGINMFKIGITFKEDHALREKIQQLIGVDDKLMDFPKEFEEFIKNE